MKSLLSVLIVAFTVAIVGPVFADDVRKAKTDADCNKAGAVWNAATKTCSEKKI
jgi:hypothetical protein